MVFCFQNCSDPMWEKIVIVIEKNWIIIAKFMRSLKQFIQTVKGRTNFWHGMFFWLVPGGFSDLINQNHLNLNWKKNGI